MTVKGKIYPEYWVDCFDCERAVPCAETTKSAAITSVVQMGWTKTPQGWQCPACWTNQHVNRREAARR